MQQTDLSVVHGASEPPLLNRTIGQQLDLAARQWPDRDAVVSPSQGMQLSYFELRSRANKLAA
jgi:fatty-acyl-CoA synthase